MDFAELMRRAFMVAIVHHLETPCSHYVMAGRTIREQLARTRGGHPSGLKPAIPAPALSRIELF